MRLTPLLAAAAIAVAPPLAAAAAATAEIAAPVPGRHINLEKGGVAIQGYDPVAYFTRGAPVKGDPAIVHTYQGVRYRFADAASRAAFIANPARYAPRYGGFCAYGVARGFKVGVDPAAWSVVDGRLYLNVSKDVREKWAKDAPGYIGKADARWGEVKDKKRGVLGGIFS